MAKLYFNYSTMNAGKSTLLLQASYNYRERGMETLLLTAALDDRAGRGRIASRIGIADEALSFDSASDLLTLVAQTVPRPACVFVDEAQFLTADQVWQLARVADDLGIPVMCYGLRVDFRGRLFPGSAALAGAGRRHARGAHHLSLRQEGHHGHPPQRGGTGDHRGRAGAGRRERDLCLALPQALARGHGKLITIAPPRPWRVAGRIGLM